MTSVLRYVVPFVLLAAGGAGAAGFVLTRPKSEKAEREVLATPVEVTPVAVGPENVRIRAQGTVLPAEKVTLFAQVSGRVVWQADELVPGGRFEKGERLLRVDPRDYQVALEQSAAQIANQQLLIEQEKSRQSVAEKEWALLGGDDKASESGKALALRKPQLKTAEIGLRAAESARSQAQLNLSRTEVGSPFNAMVQSEAVDEGQLVTPQTPLATLVGTDAYWVQVSIPISNLGWFDVPQRPSDTGAEARVWQSVGTETVERKGRIIRLLGDLDAVGNMARVLVQIDDPLGQKDEGDASASSASSLPLLLGSFVQVEIEGKPLAGVLEIPRSALRENNRVYLVGEDDGLRIEQVEILWRAESSLYVRGELKVGDRVIHSPLSTVVEGMPLRVVSSDGKDESAKADADADGEPEKKP